MNKNKDLAIRLRRSGKTYNEINKKLGVPKGTLSYWFKGKDFESIKNKIYTKVQKKWSKNIIKFNKERANRIWQERFKARQEATNNIKSINNKELLLIGTALYWAEGYKKTKWRISFCNSDPGIIKIIMKFFREICKVPEEKFKLRLQIHSNRSEIKAKKYWSKITKLSLIKFGKSQTVISKSSKHKRFVNTLPYGTLHILIGDKTIVDKIKGWIAGLDNMC